MSDPIKYAGTAALRENMVKTKEWVQNQDYIPWSATSGGDLAVAVGSPLDSATPSETSLITTGSNGVGSVSLSNFNANSYYPVFLGVVLDEHSFEAASTNVGSVTGYFSRSGSTWYAYLQVYDSLGSGVEDFTGKLKYLKAKVYVGAEVYDDR